MNGTKLLLYKLEYELCSLEYSQNGQKSNRRCVVLLLSPAAQLIVFHGSKDFNGEVTMIVSCYLGVSRLCFIARDQSSAQFVRT